MTGAIWSSVTQDPALVAGQDAERLRPWSSYEDRVLRVLVLGGSRAAGRSDATAIIIPNTVETIASSAEAARGRRAARSLRTRGASPAAAAANGGRRALPGDRAFASLMRRRPAGVRPCGRERSRRDDGTQRLRRRTDSSIGPDGLQPRLGRRGRSSPATPSTCLPQGGLERKLAAAREGRPLRVKLGLDPTAPDIHLGHTVVLQKLREFQDLGHTVVLIVGDYTARVGDPSGRSAPRPVLSRRGDRRATRGRTWSRRPRCCATDERLEVRLNSEWLDMPMEELFRARAHRHGRAAARARRLRQALRRARSRSRCSSCSTRCCRATTRSRSAPTSSSAAPTRRSTCCSARDVQRAYGAAGAGRADHAAARRAPTASEKMSKSLGNHIGVTEPPEEMYGKTLRIPDAAMDELVRRCCSGSSRPPDDVGPRDAKRALARALVDALPRRRTRRRRPRRTSTACFVAHEAARRHARASQLAGGGTVHLPGAARRRASASRAREARRSARPGRREARRRAAAAGASSTSPPDGLDGRVLQVGKRQFRRLRVRD